jgi:glycerol-3-phosphate dehydrogenase (NAD(P)+)
MKVGIIGLGNMGTAIANNIASNGNKVMGWDYFQKTANDINKSHTNTQYLKGVRLSNNLKATINITEAVSDKDAVFVALPSIFIRKVLGSCKTNVSRNTIIVNVSKGIEEKTFLTCSMMLKEIFPNNEVLVLSGPSIANEFAHGFPCGVVLTGGKKETCYKIASLVETETFRTRFSTDSVGVEWSGILKNIYAIGLGIIHGTGFDSLNFKAVYITRAIEEMADLIKAIGGDKKSVYYIAGLGDLIATSFSEHSHNRRLGELLAKGFSFKDAQEKMGVLPEGLKVLRAAVYLSEKYHVVMPVADSLIKVINKEMKPKAFVEHFMKLGV